MDVAEGADHSLQISLLKAVVFYPSANGMATISRFKIKQQNINYVILDILLFKILIFKFIDGVQTFQFKHLPRTLNKLYLLHKWFVKSVLNLAIPQKSVGIAMITRQ